MTRITSMSLSVMNITKNSSSVDQGTSSGNVSNSEQFCFPLVEDDRIIVNSVNIVLFLICLFGNVLVVCVLNQRNQRQRRTKTYTNFLLSSLAVTDMVVYFMNIILLHIPFRNQHMAVCKLFAFQFIGKTASTCIVAAVSLERYYSVVHPTEFLMTWKKSRLMVLFAWYYATCCSIFDFFSHRPMQVLLCGEPPTLSCGFIFFQGTDLTITAAISSFAQLVAPLIVVVYANISITVTLLGKPSGMPWRKSRKKEGLQRSMSITSIDLSQRRYIVKVILLLTTSVIVCSLPYAITIFLIPAIGIKVDHHTVTAFFYLSRVTHVIDPFIYSFFSSEFRQICKKMFSRWWDDLKACCGLI